MTNYQERGVGRILQAFEKKLNWLIPGYVIILAAFCLAFGIGAFALTIEPDEAWILMSTMKAFGLPLPPTSALNHPVATTGGLHFVIHGLVAYVQSGDILVHRFVSISSTLLLFGIVYRTIEFHIANRILAAAGTALFAATPGFLLQASLATSEVLATTVLLVATLFWFRFGGRSANYAAIGGILFGIACATRMTCLSMLPAILIWSIYAHRGWSARIIFPAISISVAIAIYALFVAIYFAAFGDTLLNDFLFVSASASGVNRHFPGLIMRLNYMTVSDGILAMAGMVALSGWLISRMESEQSKGGLVGFCGLLLLTGGAGWMAWLLKAPIPHMRYLWPAIPLIWLSLILLSMSELRRIERARTLAVTHLTIICICAVQGLLNVRMLAVGDSLTLVYEAARRTELGTPRKLFEVRKHQDTMAAILANLPRSATIHALSEPAAYPMTYLSGRTIASLSRLGDVTGPAYLLVQPSDRSIWPARWERISWLQNNTTLEVRHGDYYLYRVHVGAAQPVR